MLNQTASSDRPSNLSAPQGVVGRLNYACPSATVGDKVDVNDLIAVFTTPVPTSNRLFRQPIPTGPYNDDVTYSGTIDVHSLVTTLAREFSSPAGVNG